MLDTHTWVWWTVRDPRLSRTVAALLATADEIGVCTISCWEVAQLAERERLQLDRDVVRWVDQALAGPGVTTLPLSARVAIDAARLPRADFPADPADRIIYATARALAAPLATKDRQIRAFDPASTVW